MATIKQRKALDIMVENGGNVSKAMKEAKYSKNTAKTPQKLTNSMGFRELLEEKGLTNDLIVECLVEDIKGKPLNRRAELELGAKIRGLLIEKTDLNIKSINLTDLFKTSVAKERMDDSQEGKDKP